MRSMPVSQVWPGLQILPVWTLKYVELPSTDSDNSTYLSSDSTYMKHTSLPVWPGIQILSVWTLKYVELLTLDRF